MRVVRYGRFVATPGATVPLRYVERNLMSLHGRLSRLRAIAGNARRRWNEDDADVEESVELAASLPVTRGREWLLLRDYDSERRDRSVIFFFRNGSNDPEVVVKVRRRAAGGRTLHDEADALTAIRARLDERLRATIPAVDHFTSTESHELLAMTVVPGRSLSLSMQRSLRPRAAHLRHLAAAGRWLGAFHRATRNGSETAVHGDFWSRNILFGDDPHYVSGVVDWEHASPAGDPSIDVFALAIDFATAAPAWRKSDRMAEFRNAFFAKSRLARAVASYLRAYDTAFGERRGNRRAAFEAYVRSRHPELERVLGGTSVFEEGGR